MHVVLVSNLGEWYNSIFSWSEILLASFKLDGVALDLEKSNSDLGFKEASAVKRNKLLVDSQILREYDFDETSVHDRDAWHQIDLVNRMLSTVWNINEIELIWVKSRVLGDSVNGCICQGRSYGVLLRI